ncbi:MAG TPA: M23 family metallopeptidase [Methylomirabilota bacterium]|nr:M23 family metallopeptidase [Methylomirabilota bacterium]
MSPNRKSRIKLFRNPLTALALLYAVVLLGCAPEGTTSILSYHGLPVGRYSGGSSVRHPGVDFAAFVGDPVIAAADGVVVQAGFGWGCGKGVSIEHRAQEAPLGWTLYCHFTEINVREGQTVKRGDVLGTAGTSGNTGGVPHVHFGLCPNKPCPWSGGFADNVDPLAFIVGCFNPARPLGYPAFETSEGGSRLVLTYPVQCTGRAHAQ